MRSFQGNGVQGNRGGLGKQPLSLAKKGISCELQVRLPRYACNDKIGQEIATSLTLLAMTIRASAMTALSLLR